MFKDRAEAAERLSHELRNYMDHKDAIVVAIPRGGLPVGYGIGSVLNLPLEMVLSKKLGHPLHKEFAIGAVTMQDIILSPDAEGVPKHYIKKEVKSIRKKLERRKELYYGSKMPLKLKDKIVILVDDGVATGQTLLSAISLIEKQQPLRIVVALPVSPASTLKKIKALPSVNDVHCLLVPDNFNAVGQFYEDFGQVDDQQVIKLFKEFNQGSALS